LAETAASLESAATNKDMKYCLEHYPAYQAELLALHEKLSDIFPDKEIISDKKAGDTAYLNEQLLKALAAAGDLDEDVCVETLSDLLTYDFGDTINTKLKNAMMAVEEFAFDKAVNILEQISKQ
jgi:hypothetical protein